MNVTRKLYIVIYKIDLLSIDILICMILHGRSHSNQSACMAGAFCPNYYIYETTNDIYYIIEYHACNLTIV